MNGRHASTPFSVHSVDLLTRLCTSRRNESAAIAMNSFDMRTRPLCCGALLCDSPLFFTDALSSSSGIGVYAGARFSDNAKSPGRSLLALGSAKEHTMAATTKV